VSSNFVDYSTLNSHSQHVQDDPKLLGDSGEVSVPNGVVSNLIPVVRSSLSLDGKKLAR